MENRVIDGRFELVDRLGGGGMGLVWRAWDQALHREVALKEVRPPDPAFGEHDPAQARELRARVLREARALARLNHPHVVTIHHIVDTGEDGFPWLVMELVTGGSLLDRLSDGPMAPAEAARLGREVLSALRAAHAVGILHRDVKPGNVLLRPDGRSVLTDFGIAAVSESPGLTATGSFIGSPEYMAPERINGHEGDPASDLWSLGMLLYVAVEGRHPLRRATPLATLAAVLNQEVPPPERAGALSPVLFALLNRDPAARPDPDTLDRMLSAAAHDTPPLNSPPAGGFAPRWQGPPHGGSAHTGPGSPSGAGFAGSGSPGPTPQGGAGYPHSGSPGSMPPGGAGLPGSASPGAPGSTPQGGAGHPGSASPGSPGSMPPGGAGLPGSASPGTPGSTPHGVPAHYGPGSPMGGAPSQGGGYPGGSPPYGGGGYEGAAKAPGWNTLPPQHGATGPGRRPGRRGGMVAAVVGVVAVTVTAVVVWVVQPDGGGAVADDPGTSAGPGGSETEPSETGNRPEPSETGNRPEPSETGPEPSETQEPEKIDLLTPAGMRTVVAELKPVMKGTEVVDLTVYPEYALAEAPVKGRRAVYDKFTYRDGVVSKDGPGGTVNDPIVDLRDYNWDALPRLLRKAEKELGVKNPTSRYIIVDAVFYDQGSIRVYVSDEYHATGYLAADPTGKVLAKYPAKG